MNVKNLVIVSTLDSGGEAKERGGAPKCVIGAYIVIGDPCLYNGLTFGSIRFLSFFLYFIWIHAQLVFQKPPL